MLQRLQYVNVAMYECYVPCLMELKLIMYVSRFSSQKYVLRKTTIMENIVKMQGLNQLLNSVIFEVVEQN